LADLFRRLEDYKCGPHGGGVKCDCCNWTKARGTNLRTKKRIQLHKQVRQVLKRELTNSLKEI